MNPTVSPETAAHTFLAAARAVEEAWKTVDPRTIGPDVWDRVVGADPLGHGPVNDFYGSAPRLIRALRGLARRVAPTVLVDPSRFDPEPEQAAV